MPRKTLSQELKTAISRMPVKEKDKLLLRLVVKDTKLMDRLEFELLEHGDTREMRRVTMQQQIEQQLLLHQKYYYSPGYLLLVLRDLSGHITRHVAATKDKYGEVELNFLLLNLSFKMFGPQLRKANPKNAQTFNEYVVKRALKLLSLLSKMHEDLHLDFHESMKQLGTHLSDQPTTLTVANYYGLNIKQLLAGEVL